MSNKINDQFILKWNQLKEENSSSAIDNLTYNLGLNTSLDSEKSVGNYIGLQSNQTMSAFNLNINDNSFTNISHNRTQMNSDSHNNKQLSQQFPVICGDVTADNSVSNNTSDNTELMVSQRKMPVSELQEICIKKGLKVPEYRLIRAEGQSHSPLFTIQAIIDGLVVCEGMATTKKLAKHNAAEKALTELKSRPELIATDIKEKVIIDFSRLKMSGSDNCDSSVGTSAKNESQTITEINDSKASKLNPVSVLQEICAKNGISLPAYEQLDQLGPSHDPTFWFLCKIVMENEDISAKGSGKTKQVAKRIAAEEALKILCQKEIVSATKSKKNKPKTTQNNTNIDSQSDSNEMLEFLEALYDYHELDSYFESNDSDYCLRLNIIAEKMGCFANYVKFTEEQSKSNKFKCLLQLKKNNAILRRLPVFVSWGNSSTSLESAMQKAAQKAIIMIKVLKM